MRMHLWLREISLAGVMVVVPSVASVASAQLAGGVVVTPYVGAYMPTDHVARTGVAPGGVKFSVDAKHQIAAVYGGNVSYWLNDHFAIEAGGAYTSSGLRSLAFVDQPGVVTTAPHTENAHVAFGSIKLMRQLLPEESNFNVRFGIGPAIISRGGTAYGGTAYNGVAAGKITGLTDYGAAISLCTRMSFTSDLALRLRAENYMYYSSMGWKSATSSSQDFNFDSRLQNDFVFSAGLQLFFHR